jgi:hypothetical protein
MTAAEKFADPQPAAGDRDPHEITHHPAPVSSALS